MRAKRRGNPIAEVVSDDIVTELFLQAADAGRRGERRFAREAAVFEVVTSYGFEIGESIGDVGMVPVLMLVYEEGGEALLRKVIEQAGRIGYDEDDT